MLNNSVQWVSDNPDPTVTRAPNAHHEMPNEDEERIEKLFQSLDLDGNGIIDIHDLSVKLKGEGVSPVYVKVSIPILILRYFTAKETVTRALDRIFFKTHFMSLMNQKLFLMINIGVCFKNFMYNSNSR